MQGPPNLSELPDCAAQAAAELTARRLAKVTLLGDPHIVRAQAAKINADISQVSVGPLWQLFAYDICQQAWHHEQGRPLLAVLKQSIQFGASVTGTPCAS